MSKQHRKVSNKLNILVDIVIPVYRRFDLLEQCLNALPDAAGGVSYRVILVDNGSPEDEKVFYNSLSPDIKVIRNKQNLGFPKGCNMGASVGYSPLVFFLNSDLIMKPGSLELLVRNMDDPKVGVVGMKLIFPDDPGTLDGSIRPANKLQHIGLAVNIRANVFHLFMGWNPNHPKVQAMRNVQFVTGAALMTRRSLFLKAGKFFEGYGLGTWEDIDLCVEIRKLGYNIVVEPKAEGIHYTSASATTYGIGFNLEGNRQLFLSRHGKDLIYDEWQYG